MTDLAVPNLPGGLSWSDRASVPSAMLNPALVACVVAEAAREFGRTAARRARGGRPGPVTPLPLPFPLAFVAVPMVLHRPTREALPSTTRTYLSVWAGREPVLRAGVGVRAASLAEVTREGLRFGVRHQVLDLLGGGLQVRKGAVRSSAAVEPSRDVADLMYSAGFVGRWFAVTGRPSTVMDVLGVRP